MNIKINQYGSLQIRKLGEYVLQHCPYHTVTEMAPDGKNCGLWCPHFHIRETLRQGDDGEQIVQRELELCGGTKYRINKMEVLKTNATGNS